MLIQKLFMVCVSKQLTWLNSNWILKSVVGNDSDHLEFLYHRHQLNLHLTGADALYQVKEFFTEN